MTEMVGGLFAALRPVLVALLVGGAATAVVAPALDMATQQHAASAGQAPLRNEHPGATPQPTDEPDPSTADFETLLRMCLETRDPDSSACADAAVASDMSFVDFRAKIVAKLEGKTPPMSEPDPTSRPEPTKKPEPKPSFDVLLGKCLDSRDVNSDWCVRAQELSGLSEADFRAKVLSKIANANAGEFEKSLAKCVDSRDLESDACFRAQQLSGMSDADFRVKVQAKIDNANSAEFEKWFGKCLDSHDVNSDACFRAQQLSGLSDADFQAKVQSKIGTPKPKTEPKPGSAMSFETLFAMCGQTHERASNACLAAQAVSGLSPDAFWAKAEAKFGAFR